ncbi:hypothetical protein HKX48_005499 [Thoreauomyces humboldtii]|nr:hypothetical protein HKX48_005499 [Thoreauomyces humboldtii]
MKLSISLAAAGVLASCVAAQAPLNVTRIVTFGDSFSDNGNVLKVSGVPLPPYWQGRFSNGMNYVDYLSQDLAAINDNHAYGGAVANRTLLPAASPSRNATFPPDINEQLAAYLKNASGVYPDPATTIYPIFIGANDYLDALGAKGVPNPQAIAGSVINFVRILASPPLNATRILMMYLPDFGKTPVFTQPTGSAANSSSAALGATIASSFAKAHNQVLVQGVQQLNAELPNVQISTVDLVQLIADVEGSNTTTFKDITNACISLAANTPKNITSTDQAPTKDIVQCASPNTTLYWDRIHPTTTGHKLVSDAALAALTATFNSTANSTSNSNSSSTAGGNGSSKSSAGRTASSSFGVMAIASAVFGALVSA